MDGHTAHTFNLEALKKLNENKVFALAIPAHTSHVFNIGDRTVFGNLKKYWRESCTEYQKSKKHIILEDFPFIFKTAWDKAVNQKGIINCNSLIFLELLTIFSL